MLSDLAPLERLGLKVYDLPTYADLDEVVSNPSFFGPRYGITFTDVTDPAWTGNFTDPNSGTLAPGANHYLFFDTVHPTALAHHLTADIAYNVLAAPPLT